MEQEVVTQVVGLGGSTDFSLIQLFLRADFIVKAVIVILIAASVYSWALIFDKYKLFKRIEKSTTSFEEKFWKSKSAESFYNNFSNKEKDPVATIFQSAMIELIRTKSKSSSVQSNRVTRVLEISADKEIKLIEKHFTILDKDNTPLPYANIVYLNTGKGTISNENGNFVIDVSSLSDADIIRFQCIGYKTKDYKIESLKSNSIILLSENIYTLDEVMILGTTPNPEEIVKNILVFKIFQFIS